VIKYASWERLSRRWYGKTDFAAGFYNKLTNEAKRTRNLSVPEQGIVKNAAIGLWRLAWQLASECRARHPVLVVALPDSQKIAALMHEFD
jgi:hypothetical protein